MKLKIGIRDYRLGFDYLNNHPKVVSLDIFLRFLLLVLILNKAALGIFSTLLSFPLALFLQVFAFSVPALLLKKVTLSVDEMFEITVKNLRRLIFPLLGLSFLSGLLAFSIVIVLLGRGLPAASIIDLLKSPIIRLISSLISIPMSLFIFTSIFFSIEGVGFFRSLYKSLIFSVKNLDFVWPIILYSVVGQLIPKGLIPNTLIGSYLLPIGSAYIDLIIVASCLLYYQRRGVSQRVDKIR